MKKLLLGFALVAPVVAFADLNQVATQIASNSKAFPNISTKSSNDPITIEIYDGSGKVSASATSTPEEFVAAVRAKVPAKTITAGGYRYTINWQQMSVAIGGSNKDLYNILVDIKDHQTDPADNQSGEGSISESFRPLSIVGPLVSVNNSGDDYYPGAAHPNNWDYFQTVDVRKASAADGDMSADLVSLVNEQSLLQAIKADKYLAKQITDKDAKKQILASKTMKELTDVMFGALDNCLSFPGYEGKMQSFAIYDYDAKANLVSVRVPLTAAAHVCQADAAPAQLGLKVKPNAELEAMLRAQAQSKDGLLMKNAPK